MLLFVHARVCACVFFLQWINFEISSCGCLAVFSQSRATIPGDIGAALS